MSCAHEEKTKESGVRNDVTRSPEKDRVSYPKTRTVDQVDTYHGTAVKDPYRWLEDTDSQETAEWVKAQNELTFSWLGMVPTRAAIKARLTKLWDFERYGVPRKQGGRYFFSKNDGLQNQAVLYVAATLDAEPRALLDPNLLSKDGTVSLQSYVPSEDGKLLAYGLQSAGSDWETWKVRDVETGKDLTDVVDWVKFSAASWKKDGSGFFYSRYDAPEAGKQLAAQNYFQKLFFHKIGTPQSEDALVYKRDDEKEWGFGGTVSEDGR
ncbi:S9 family peptidase, partial [bacterium]|nr:S9 family peptidase [bacterium]